MISKMKWIEVMEVVGYMIGEEVNVKVDSDELFLKCVFDVVVRGSKKDRDDIKEICRIVDENIK